MSVPQSNENEMHRQRLLNAARAVREGEPGDFTMARFHRCGTPACVLGHYASRPDLQSDFRLRTGWDFPTTIRGEIGLGFDAVEFMEHFGLGSFTEMKELFAPSGCGGACTNERAAAYVEQFVERKWANPTSVGFAAFRAASLSALKETP